MELLIIYGFIVGMVAGFFGVGGGMLLVPVLLLSGYSMSEAVGISVIQMFFASLYGSYLNFRANRLELSIVLYIASGGLIGSFLSVYVVKAVPDIYLELLLTLVVLFSIIKMFFTPVELSSKPLPHAFVLFLLGGFIGLLASSVGVGGAIFLIPILNGIWGYELKKASVVALFFVVFSSSSALFSWILSGGLLIQEGLVVGGAALFGVYLGIYLVNKTHPKHLKRYTLMMNMSLFGILLYRLFIAS